MSKKDNKLLWIFLIIIAIIFIYKFQSKEVIMSSKDLLPTDKGQIYGQTFVDILNEDGTRTRTTYLTTKYIQEDGGWKLAEKARSLKDKGFKIVYLEKDPSYNFKIIDFNWTSLTFKPILNLGTQSLINFEQGNLEIPIKVDDMIQSTINFDTASDVQTLNFKGGILNKEIKIGEHSTTIQLTSSYITANSVIQSSPNSVYIRSPPNTQIVINIDGTASYGLFRFNLGFDLSTVNVLSHRLIVVHEGGGETDHDGYYDADYSTSSWNPNTVTWNNKPFGSGIGRSAYFTKINGGYNIFTQNEVKNGCRSDGYCYYIFRPVADEDGRVLMKIRSDMSVGAYVTMLEITYGPLCTPNSYVSCYNNDEYYYDSCNNLGTIKTDCGEDSYTSFGSNYCKNNNVYHSRTYYDKGCSGISCFNTPSTDEQLVQTCSYGCTSGVCNAQPGQSTRTVTLATALGRLGTSAQTVIYTNPIDVSDVIKNPSYTNYVQINMIGTSDYPNQPSLQKIFKWYFKKPLCVTYTEGYCFDRSLSNTDKGNVLRVMDYPNNYNLWLSNPSWFSWGVDGIYYVVINNNNGCGNFRFHIENDLIIREYTGCGGAWGTATFSKPAVFPCVLDSCI